MKLSGPGDEWFIVFDGGRRHFWWDRWTGPGMRHVQAMRPIGADAWLLVNPCADRLNVEVVGGAFVDRVIAKAHREGGCVLKFQALDAAERTLRLGGWCVPVVRHLLGIRGCALRPRGLWRDLLRRGAVPAFESADEPEDAEAAADRQADPGPAAVGVPGPASADT